MPVDSTKAMPSSTSRSEVRGRPVRPCTAGFCVGISGSTTAHSSSLLSRDGGEEADGDMPPHPPPNSAWPQANTPRAPGRHLQRLLSHPVVTSLATLDLVDAAVQSGHRE